jgi:putative endopeptidase
MVRGGLGPRRIPAGYFACYPSLEAAERAAACGKTGMKALWLNAAAAAALTLAAAPAAVGAPAPTTAPTAAAVAGPAAQATRMGPWGFDLSGRDPSVAAGDNLFRYAGGGYVDRLQIPPDRSRYGAFDRLIELSQARMHAVLDKTAADPGARGDQAKVGALYRSFMDQAAVDALGAKPLAPDLDAVRAAASPADIARLMGQAHRGLGGSVIAAEIEQDAKAPDRYAVYLAQAGLGMPDRDYYMQPGFAPQKAAYEAYVRQILDLAGWPDPAGAAKAIVAFETQIAEASWTQAERRDRDKTYNPVPVADLSAFAPGFDWSAFLGGARLAGARQVILAENTAIPKIAAIYARTPLATLKAWQAFTIADQAAPYLSQPFVEAHFAFRQKTLQGQPQLQPRWKRGVQLVDSQIGEALGRLYVAAYFPPESKAQMQTLVGDIRTALHGRIEKLAWMSPQTKGRALEKLDKLTVKIGYPDKWRDYSALDIREGDLYGDVSRAVAFEWDYQVARLDTPVDRGEWGMTPPTVNAYYNPTMNEIVFPAAILQPPFFDPKADPAVNYGGIGGVIGHEITHGFDDQGRKSDGDGRLSDWWTPADAARFKAEADKLGRQYAAVEPLPGAHINPDLTMGENIADLGGLHLALDAYHASLHGRPAPVIDGLTGDQRVFLGWAQVWRGKIREDRLRQMLVSDPHSPNEARVNLPARNVDGFYEAFGVKPGQGMYVAPAARARIW